MCKISNEIKLCTCNSTQLTNSINYWIIYRRKKGWRVGETIFNENILKIEEIELEKIEHKLNSTNMFDFIYKPQEDDKLEINLYYGGKNCEFTFKFVQNKWKIYNDALEWIEDIENDKLQYLTEYSGIIKNPFK